MLFTFTCPSCNRKVEADASLSGSQLACPHCQDPLAVPQARVGPGATLTGFRLDRLLGKGGMGEVYLGTQLSVERQVAVKVLPPGFAEDAHAVERFLHEGRLAARLDHANIVTVHEAGEDNGHYYLAMAYVEGESLDRRLKRSGPLNEGDALGIVRSMADALRYAWGSFQLLHRDIKPANIMVDGRGRVFLMDLGLAKSLAEESGFTLSGTILGTPHYMSPEQALGSSQLTVSTDIYSLGATLYHLIVGSPPFTADSALQVLNKHVHDPLPSPRERNPEITEGCDRLIHVMMAKKAEDRYGDWGALIADIDHVLAGRMPAAHRPDSGQSVVQPAAVSADRSDAVSEPSVRHAHDRSALARQAQEALARRHQAQAKAKEKPPGSAEGTRPRSRRKMVMIGVAAGVVLLLVVLGVVLSRRGGGKVAGTNPQAAGSTGTSARTTDQTGRTRETSGTDEPDRTHGSEESGTISPPGTKAVVPKAAPKPPPEKEASPAPPPAVPPAMPNGYRDLMDLALWTTEKPGSWTLTDGVLTHKDRGYLWTRDRFDNFELRLEFALEANANGGVCLRVGDTADPVNSGLKVQLIHPSADTPSRTLTCGALWDMMAPSQNAAKPPGEWNQLTVVCRLNRIQVDLNGTAIVDADVDKWTVAGSNPDGTTNKFKTAVRDFPRRGVAGLQGFSATKVMFRRICIKPLPDADAPAENVTKDPDLGPASVHSSDLSAVASCLFSGDEKHALLEWEKAKLNQPAAFPADLDRTIREVGAMSRHVLDSFSSDVGKAVDVQLAKETLSCEIREVTDGAIKVYALVRRGNQTGKTGRTIRYEDLSVQEKLRRLGSGDTPELNLQRGLLAMEAERPDIARKFFEKAGGPLATALVAELDRRDAEAAEKAADRAARDLLRAIARSTWSTKRDEIIAEIRAKCGGSPEIFRQARKLADKYAEDYGDTGTGEKWTQLFRAALGFPFTGSDWTVPALGMEFVWIKALNLWVGKYEVTNAEYRAFKRDHDSKDFNGHSVNGDRQPVVYVNFEDACAYAVWLTEREHAAGRLADGLRYRLPTEEEFMAYAQCGDGREYPWGDNWPPQSGRAGNYRGEEGAGAGPKISGYRDGYAVTCDVEQSWANPWGLYGVGGNVWEACAGNTAIKQSFGAWRGASWNILPSGLSPLRLPHQPRRIVSVLLHRFSSGVVFSLRAELLFCI